jgi:NADH-quinone oxidoreductase subunit I
VVPTVPLALSGEQQRRRGTLREYFGSIYRAVTSTFEGLSVTMSWMFRRPLTVQYPDKIEKPVQEMLPDGYRGALEVDMQRCVACLLCQRTCPIGCIKIEVGKNAETGEREFTRFDIDIGRCMYCGLCTEVCNYDAIVHTTQFETTAGHPEQLVLHFVTKPVPVPKHKAGEGPPRRPRGSILAEVVPEFGRRRGARRWPGKAAAPAAPPETPPSKTPPSQTPPPAEPGATQGGRSDG